MEVIDVHDLYEMIEERSLTKEDIILDVRTSEEFAAGHIEGAINIPVDELEMRTQEISAARRIIILCRVGARAQKAMGILYQKGFKDGLICLGTTGMMHWHASDYPMVVIEE